MNPDVQKFFDDFPEWGKVEWDGAEVTVYHNDSTEPFGALEFVRYSRTRDGLELLEEALCGLEPFEAMRRKSE